jgi:hypothetical protein
VIDDLISEFCFSYISSPLWVSDKVFSKAETKPAKKIYKKILLIIKVESGCAGERCEEEEVKEKSRRIIK